MPFLSWNAWEESLDWVDNLWILKKEFIDDIEIFEVLLEILGILGHMYYYTLENNLSMAKLVCKGEIAYIWISPYFAKPGSHWELLFYVLLYVKYA